MDANDSLQRKIKQLEKEIELLIKIIHVKDKTINRLLDHYILKK